MNWVATVFKWWAITTAAPAFLKFLFIYAGALLSKQPDAIARVTQSGADLIVAVIVPWWLDPLAFLASLPGLLGALATLSLVFLLFKTGNLSAE